MKDRLLPMMLLCAALPVLSVASPESPTPGAAAATKASAETQSASGEAKMDAATLGRLDALFAVCAKADKTNQAVYEKRRAEMIVFGEGTRYEMRVPGSDTKEYKAAYAEVVEAVGKTSAEDLLSQCSRVIGADAEK